MLATRYRLPAEHIFIWFINNVFASNSELLESIVEGRNQEDLGFHAFTSVAIIEILIAFVFDVVLLHKFFDHFHTKVSESGSVKVIAHFPTYTLHSSFNKLTKHHTSRYWMWVKDDIRDHLVCSIGHLMRWYYLGDNSLTTLSWRYLITLLEITNLLQLNANSDNILLILNYMNVFDSSWFVLFIY